MEKLELKHLTPYLLYKLKGNVSDHGENEHWENTELQSLCLVDKILSFADATDVYLDEPNETEFKPVLRPLSDLTKEIEWKGVGFYPIERLLSADEDDLNEFYLTGKLNSHWEAFIKVATSKSLIRSIDYWMVEIMFEWHFDVFGLIEKGLAIDINTLK